MPTFFETQIQTHPQYLKIMALPKLQCGGIWIGLFLAAQLTLSGLLYLFFGKIVMIGFLASSIAGLATGLGALPALFLKQVSDRVVANLLGAAAGVMLAATIFSLIIPGIYFGDLLWPEKGLWLVAIGMIIGALFLHVVEDKLPHLSFASSHSLHLASLQKMRLFIIAITLHNFPEGMSVGVSFGSGDLTKGLAVSIAIALQNIAEGLAVALPLIGLGYHKWKAVGIATLTGLVEPIGGLLGVTIVTWFTPLLSITMGFAAGAMLFVISEAIIPQTQAKGRCRSATFALIGGFIIMMLLDNLLG
jgi:ZIP family zinc transporter